MYSQNSHRFPPPETHGQLPPARYSCHRFGVEWACVCSFAMPESACVSYVILKQCCGTLHKCVCPTSRTESGVESPSQCLSGGGCCSCDACTDRTNPIHCSGRHRVCINLQHSPRQMDYRRTNSKANRSSDVVGHADGYSENAAGLECWINHQDGGYAWTVGGRAPGRLQISEPREASGSTLWRMDSTCHSV